MFSATKYVYYHKIHFTEFVVSTSEQPVTVPGRVISGAGRKEREREGDDQCRLVLSFTWPHYEEAAAFRT